MSEWLPWAPFAAVCCHLVEEFVWPGGFTGWYQMYRGGKSRLTPTVAVTLNGLLLLACAFYALYAETPLGAAALLGICALLASNGLWHAWASVKSHTVSPGIVTGILIYVPLVILEYEIFLRAHRVSVGAALAAAAIGSSYHIWSGLYHRAVAKA